MFILEHEKQSLPNTLKIPLANTKHKYDWLYWNKANEINDLKQTQLIICIAQCDVQIRCVSV